MENEQETLEVTEAEIPAEEQAAEVVDESATSEEVEETAEVEPVEDEQSGVDKRINEITRKRYDAEREADYWKQVALENQKQQQPQQPQQQAQQPQPTVDQFNTYDEFVEALTDYKANVAAHNAVTAYQNQQTQQQKQTTIQGKMTEAQEKYEDFNAVVNNPATPSLQGPLIDAVYASDNFADLSYHLAANPQEIKKLNAMPPLQAVMHLGRIEAGLNRPAQRTSAPAPPKKIGGKGTVITKNPDNMTPQEYNKWRQNGRK